MSSRYHNKRPYNHGSQPVDQTHITRSKRPRFEHRDGTPSSTSQTPAVPLSMDAVIAAKKAEIQAKFRRFLPHVAAANEAALSAAPPTPATGSGATSSAAGKDSSTQSSPARPTIPNAAAIMANASAPLKSGLQVQQHPLISALYGESKKGGEGAGSATATGISNAVKRAMLIPKANIASTKANQRMAQKLQGRKAFAPIPVGEKEEPKRMELQIERPLPITASPFFDPRTQPTKGIYRPNRALRFNRPGKITEKVERVRAELRIAQLKRDIQDRVKATGMEMKVELVSDKTLLFPDEPPPTIEWWDTPLVYNSRSYDEVLRKDLVFNDLIPVEEGSSDRVLAITHYIYHPIPIPPPFESKEKACVRPLMLTKSERRKLRRQRRAEILKEKQDKIRLGLLPPEQPKVRIANLMRVLGTEAVAEPSRVEAEVRRQMKVRQKEHDARNKANKLTKQQRWEKRQEKATRDEARGIFCCVYRAKSLEDPRNRYKVEVNAQQHGLTGVGLLYGSCNLVIVEGGAKAIKKYKRLMLRRIKWDLGGPSTSTKVAGDSDQDDGSSSDTDEEGNPSLASGTAAPPLDAAALKSSDKCTLVWEGEIQHRKFHKVMFRFRECDGERQLLDILEEYEAQEYWDAAKTWVHPTV